jgi:hypothetical protein
MNNYALFLDDIRKPPTMIFDDGIMWVIARSYEQFVKIVTERGLPVYLSADHDLADEHYQQGASTNFKEFDYSKIKEKTGFDCVKWLVEYCRNKNVLFPKWKCHSMNPRGKENIEKFLLAFEKIQQQESI